ncbi:phosphate signaling complex protein PhoU [Pseudogemmobacter sonorensis]|uniref:phosphate signaling complex protein PhoU n=1 Tax=Pseudogemmobacter sonorensis TaxID=2989681 RepID=UPI0036D1B1D4
MKEAHIHSAFDNDLEAVQAQVMKMGGLVEKALLDAAEALDRRDEVLAQSVREGDRAVDGLDDLIQTECARIIALRGPTASDLRTVLTVMRIATLLERSGDYAKNLAKRSNVLMQMPAISGASGAVQRMAKLVVQQLSDALDAYIARDAAKAWEVRARDQEVDQMYSGMFRQFLTYMLEDPRTITACMHLHFIAKNIERVGDHATGIAEQVIYLVEGQLPAEDRPKHDAVSASVE